MGTFQWSGSVHGRFVWLGRYCNATSWKGVARTGRERYDRRSPAYGQARLVPLRDSLIVTFITLVAFVSQCLIQFKREGQTCGSPSAKGHASGLPHVDGRCRDGWGVAPDAFAAF